MTAPGPRRDLEAVVFDFDGTIFDSETPIFLSARAALAELGHTLSVQAWSSVIGRGEDDSFAALEAALGTAIDRDAYEAGYARQDRSWRDDLPVLPGISDLVSALGEAGIACGVASSSSAEWVETHLERLGLRSGFGSVATRDRVGGRAKPAPDTYLLACRELGADPIGCVAIEDSAPGIVSARAAGLAVVAVPSHITVHTDLSDADVAVASVADVTVDALRVLVANRP